MKITSEKSAVCQNLLPVEVFNKVLIGGKETKSHQHMIDGSSFISYRTTNGRRSLVYSAGI
jgi:hypothetical protein